MEAADAHAIASRAAKLAAANSPAAPPGGGARGQQMSAAVGLLSRLNKVPDASEPFLVAQLQRVPGAEALVAVACLHESAAARALDDPTAYQKAVSIQQVRAGRGVDGAAGHVTCRLRAGACAPGSAPTGRQPAAL